MLDFQPALRFFFRIAIQRLLFDGADLGVPAFHHNPELGRVGFLRQLAGSEGEHSSKIAKQGRGGLLDG